MESKNSNSSAINRIDLSISMAKANLYSIFFVLPITVMALIFIGIWGIDNIVTKFESADFLSLYLISLFLIFVGIVLHEIIHGVTWMYFSKKPFTTIKFGVNWKVLSPYAHCTEPMGVNAYRLGAMMPGLLVGVLPYLVGLFSGNIWITLFGLFFTFAASGDAIIIWSIRKVEKGKQVEDHPTRAGCFVVLDDNFIQSEDTSV
jgi:hypothetical protein